MKSQKAKDLILEYAAIVVGTAIFAAGFQFFLYPNSIIVGGVSGIAMIINMLSGLPVGLLTVILNIPLFAIAWKKFGMKFIIGSLVGMLLSSAFIDLFAIFEINPTSDLLLASIIGGAVKGFGLGLVYYVGATTGGVDIVAKFLRRKFSFINFGTLMLIIDCVIIAAFAIIFHKLESAMYAVISLFVVSRTIDLVLYGFDNASVCYIVSRDSEAIAREINESLKRGVTILEGQGAYSHEHKQVLLCVIKRHQIGNIRKLIRSIDEKAFLIVTDAKNVFGNGFEDIGEIG